MSHVLIWARWGLVCFLAYVAALMKEEQEGRWENALEAWLKKVYGRQQGSYARVTALARAVAALSERITERLFGRRLFSLRFLGVSVFYGLASANLTMLLSPLMPHRVNPPQLPLPAAGVRPNFFWYSVWLVAFLLLGSVPALIERRGGKSSWVWVVWFAFVARWALPFLAIAATIDRLWGHYSEFRFILGICILVGLNFLLDIVFVSVSRWALRLASNASQLPKVILAILLEVGLGYGVIVGPLWLGVEFWTRFHAGALSIAPMLVFVLKSIDFLIALLVLIILALIGVHAILWFVLERPIYACLRFKVIRDKKLLRGIILALIALPQIGSAWAFFVALLKAI